MPACVTEAVVEHLELESREGGYEAAEARSQALENIYTSVARMLGASPEEIALSDNATRAWMSVFYALPLSPGARILTCSAEYASNAIAFFQRAQREQLEIVQIPDAPSGQLCLEALERELKRGAALMSLCHVPTNSGLVQPAKEVGALCQNHGVPFLLDACQSAGQLPLNVEELACDFLSATSRKYLRGPRGIGFLYVSSSWLERLEPAYLDLHSAVWDGSRSYSVRPDARRFEVWEADYAARLGFGRAVDYYLDLDAKSCWERIRSLAQQLRSKLERLDGVRVWDRGAELGGLVTFTIRDRTPVEVKTFLSSRGIRVSTTSERAARWDMENKGIRELVRASVHYYNTEDELDKMVGALAAWL